MVTTIGSEGGLVYSEREARRGASVVVSEQLCRLHDFIKLFCFSLYSSVIGDRESEFV